MKNFNQTANKVHGFTLIEMMIVVAIIGILVAIAYPSYMNSVRKSNRADAKSALNDAAQRLQRCYTVKNSFTDCALTGTSYTSPEKFYTISVKATNSGAGFTAEAVPAKSPQTGDTDCQKMGLNQLGERTASPNTNNNCW